MRSVTEPGFPRDIHDQMHPPKPAPRTLAEAGDRIRELEYMVKRLEVAILRVELGASRKPKDTLRRNIPPRIRKMVLTRDGNKCRYCGKRVTDETRVLDHILPVSLGGGNMPDNLVVACMRCNRKKGTQLLEQAGMKLIPLE